MRGFRHFFGQLAVAGAGLAVVGCAAPKAVEPPPATVPVVETTNERGAVGANLGGARCRGGVCACRGRGVDDVETSPPDADHKRFEFRLGAGGGPATLTSSTLGTLSSGKDEACFYVDVVPGTTHEISFVAKEAKAEEGVSPELELAEYGPKGPWWYDVLVVKCDGPGGHCNREAADAWSAELKTRKRGRLDPCGSAVIKNLKWDTTGGAGVRDLGVFADFRVSFTLEVKKFPTQFAPGSTECVPK